MASDTDYDSTSEDSDIDAEIPHKFFDNKNQDKKLKNYFTKKHSVKINIEDQFTDLKTITVLSTLGMDKMSKNTKTRYDRLLLERANQKIFRRLKQPKNPHIYE